MAMTRAEINDTVLAWMEEQVVCRGCVHNKGENRSEKEIELDGVRVYCQKEAKRIYKMLLETSDTCMSIPAAKDAFKRFMNGWCKNNCPMRYFNLGED